MENSSCARWRMVFICTKTQRSAYLKYNCPAFRQWRCTTAYRLSLMISILHFYIGDRDISHTLHGPSMFAVKAKINRVLYKQSSSIAFDEASSYWSAPKDS